MPIHSRSHSLALGGLLFILLSLTPATGGPAVRGVTAAENAAVIPPGWVGFTYGGAQAGSAAFPGYTIAYPATWFARLWPDTLATYGHLDLYAPSGATVNLVVVPLRPGGPTLSDLAAADADSLHAVVRRRVALAGGVALRVSGIPLAVPNGLRSELLYLRRGALLYRLFLSHSVWANDGNLPWLIATTLRTPIPRNAPLPTPRPPSVPPAAGGGCCHCPAYGAGWGRVLTRLDGIAVYSNAGDGDNGCTTTYGISYQCVELAQRYFAQRWGYPGVWWGVAGAADMRTQHPADLQFIPNGGSPGPQEGDALVFDGGGFGHVGIVSAVDRGAGQLSIVEQNWSPTGTARLPLYLDNVVGLRNSVTTSFVVAGWLHSPHNSVEGTRTLRLHLHTRSRAGAAATRDGAESLIKKG